MIRLHARGRTRVWRGLLLPLLAATVVTLLALSVCEDVTFLAGMSLLLGVGGSAAWRNRRHAALGWTFLVPAFYVCYFVAIPLALWAGGALELSTVSGVTAALIWVSLGLCAFQCAVIIATALHAKRRRPTTSTGRASCWALASQPCGIVVLSSIGLVGLGYSFLYGYFGLTSNLRHTGGLAGVMSLVSSLASVGLVLSWTRFFRFGQKPWAIFALALLVLLLGVGLFSKSKGALLFPFFHVGAAYAIERGRTPAAAFLAAALAYLFIAYPLVSSWRQDAGVEYASRWDQVAEGVGVLTSLHSMPFDATPDLQRSFARGLLEVTAQIVDRTGTDVPYARGASYGAVLESLIPRSLWPDKPDNNTGNWIGQRYSIVNRGDDVTNISPSLLGEMYMNFGGVGVLLGMALFGLLAVWLDRSLTSWAGSWLIAWSLPFAFFGQEAPLSQFLLPYCYKLLLVYAVLATLSFTQRVVWRRGHTSSSYIPLP